MMDWKDISGWFDLDFADVYDAAVQHYGRGACYVEVGCFFGRSTAYLAEKVDHLWVVDTFCGSGGTDEKSDQLQHHAGGNDWRDRFDQNMNNCGLSDKIGVMTTTSVEAARNFRDGEVDFCFLDAAHDYDSVRADIAAWSPKIREGGTLGGDDYAVDWPGVTRAVNEAFGDQVKRKGRSWWVGPLEVDGQEPCLHEGRGLARPEPRP